MKNIFNVVVIFFCLGILTNAQFKNQVYWPTQNVIGPKYLLEDFNGDGLTDIIHKSGNVWKVAFSTGKGFAAEGDMATIGSSGPGTDTTYYAGDFNGDGMADLLLCYANGINTYWKIAFSQQNNSTGQYTFSSFSTGNENLLPASLLKKVYIGDYNGDGKKDILSYLQVGTSTRWLVSLSTGTSFLNTVCWKSNENNTADSVYVADFNGDGYTDIILYKRTDTNCGLNTDVWRVSLNNKQSSFSSFSCWGSGQGLGCNANLFYDVNGDRKADKIHFYSGDTAACYVNLSMGSVFQIESAWCGRQGIGAKGYISDFNGDNLGDMAFYFPDSMKWYISLSAYPYPSQKLVGAWFNAYYWYSSPTSMGSTWMDTERDVNKTPTPGWPDSGVPTALLYNSDDEIIFTKQVDAMIKAGIDFIIIDVTNGFDNTQHDYNQLNELFTFMRNRKNQGKPYIPMAIALGKEFWGPVSYARLQWTWSSWASQTTLQQNKLNELYQNYATNFGDVYFKYLDRPLVIVWNWLGDDFPPEESGISLWQDNRFTIKNAINFIPTTSQLYPDFGGWLNGQDYLGKRFWGWGAIYPQPYNAECMSVMPGHWNRGTQALTAEIERDSSITYKGNHYINTWKQVLKENPNITLICSWNDWNEETAIEGCIGTKGWQDYQITPLTPQYDWYLQITKAYSYIFKNNALPNFPIYIQDEDYKSYNYYWNGTTLGSRRTTLPNNMPIIKLPHSWVVSHRLTLSKSNAGETEIPINFETSAYPNPFNPIVNIDYTLPETGLVEVKVFDILGREIESLVHEVKEKGSHKIRWQASNFASGVYFYRVSWKDNVISKKIVLMK